MLKKLFVVLIVTFSGLSAAHGVMGASSVDQSATNVASYCPIPN